MPPHIAPNKIPTTMPTGSSRYVGRKVQNCMTQVMPITPLTYWPSAPMFQNLRRNAIPTASPQSSSGMAFTIVYWIFVWLPNAPLSMAA
ncbi:hypothetical protein DSECCO2_624530 [anaerobic digester metagenome]